MRHPSYAVHRESPQLPESGAAKRAKPGIPYIAPEEYSAFASLLADDESFPGTYGGWLKRIHYAEKSVQALAIVVRVQEFADYCREQQAAPRLAALSALAALKSRAASTG